MVSQLTAEEACKLMKNNIMISLEKILDKYNKKIINK